MRTLIASLLFIGVAYGQDKAVPLDTPPVHPGTALLDSMNMYAGEPATPSAEPQPVTAKP
jgi:hypothetical protein